MANFDNRPFNPSNLAARRTYKGGHYVNGQCRPLERTGAEWRKLLVDMIVKRVAEFDVVALARVPDRRGRLSPCMTYEVYLD